MKTSMWLLVLSIGAVLLQQCTQSKHHEAVRYSPADSAYIYAPLHSLFQIGFPQKPKLKDVNNPADPHNISTQLASVTVEDDTTALSAQFGLYSNVYDSSAKDKIFQLLKNEAKSIGIPYPTIFFDSSRVCDCYKLHGSKFVQADNPKDSVEMMFDIDLYFKKNYLFRVSTICPVSSYPTKSIIDFEISLKLVRQ